MPTRREILKAAINGSALVALSPHSPGLSAQTARAAGPDRDGRVLVVVQLEGGNDAINTLVPFADEGYARNRKVLRMPEKGLIRVNDRVGLHPALRRMGDLLQQGHLALVPGVGYPNPNRSHFQSMAIWQTARLDPEELNGPGWIGRSLDDRAGTAANPIATGGAALFIGEETPPTALRGRRSAATSLERIEDLTLPPGSARSLVQTRLATGQGPGDDLDAFVRRSMLDAYTSAERVADLTRGRRTARLSAIPTRDWLAGSRLSPSFSKRTCPRRSFTRSSPAMTRMPASRIRIMVCSTSFPERSRRSWMTWQPRNWRSAWQSSASVSSVAGWPRTARRAPITARLGWYSWPGRKFAPVYTEASPVSRIWSTATPRSRPTFAGSTRPCWRIG